MLEIQNVSKTFNAGTVNEKTALNGLNLNLNEGDFVTVIGGNGAGKSTMLNAVAGVWPVDCGKIIIDGVDVTRLGEHQRAAYIGRVFQDPMTGTAATMQIEENLALAARRGNAMRELLDNVLVKAVLVHHASLDLERGSRHGNDARGVERTQAVRNEPQGATRADKRLMPCVMQTMKRLDRRLRRANRRKVLIGHIVGIERRQRAVHVKKEHGGIGARINHMGSFRGRWQTKHPSYN